MIKRYLKYILIPLILIGISIPIILPYFHTGYFPTHDGEWAVVRLGDMFRSLRDYQFPVRYSGNLNFGFGYPLFNFVYPAPYYIGILFHFFKFGFVDTIKLLFVFSVILSSITMYFASLELWRNKFAAVISALFYIYLPYRIVDLYARGSIGESLSFIFFPIIIFFVSKIIDKSNSKTYSILGSISYALLIMTHNIMAVLFTPLLFIFIIGKMYFAKSKKYFDIVLFILLSYGLSAFFWLPAILEKQYILLSKIPIANREIYFVNLNQLLLPKWGYGLPDHPDGFSYQVGLPHVAILLVTIFLLLYFWVTKKKLFKTIYFRLAAIFTIVTSLLFILMFAFTAAIWQVTPFLKEINYPWTLLAPIGFILSLLAGFLWLQNKFIKYIIFVLCVLAVILVIPHAKPEFYINKGDNYYLTNDATTTSSSELMPLWVKKMPTARTKDRIQIIKGKGTVSDIFFNSHIINFTLNLNAVSHIRINTIFYPGWIIRIDDHITPVTYANDQGLMEITVPAGRHNIRAEFRETNLRLLSDLISIAAVIIIFILLFIKIYKAKK